MSRLFLVKSGTHCIKKTIPFVQAHHISGEKKNFYNREKPPAEPDLKKTVISFDQ